MKRAVVVRTLLFAALCCAVPGWSAENPASALDVPTLPVNQIHAGMHGVAYTVFEGAKVEAMDVEILGVLKDANGPQSDVILVRLQGKKPEYTGVVAGMSGSPVYVDGKLVGALAFRIGQFAKDPIAGVTPIADMLEINALDRTPAESRVDPGQPRREVSRTSGLGDAAGIQQFSQYLQPIETPLVFSGFSEEAVRLFAPQFKEAGIIPVMGIGAASDQSQPEPLVPGSAVSAVLIRGDMNVAGTCTVTYVDAQRLLACGHPLLQFGRIEMPMTKAYVVTTLASPANAFKIVNTTEPVGAFVQDRHSGILGEFGVLPQMIPVALTVHGGTRAKEFHFEVLNNAKMTPVAIMTTVFNSLQSLNEYGEDATYRMSGKIRVNGYPDVGLQNMFAPIDPAQPTAFAAAITLGDRFSRIFDNPYATPSIGGVTLDFEVLKERRWARLESVRTDVTEARPGDAISIEVSLRPYRGERIVKQIPVKVPASTPKGTLRILVSDGDTLDRSHRMGPGPGRKLDLGSTIALLNKEHTNDRLYVSLLEANPQAMVEDKVMPTLPLSVMNVMDGMRGTQDMVVIGESAVNEYSTPMDYVVTGAQMIMVTIK
ncbi:MAG: SpoIVB peptidase S55 [Acidobacteriia bacterium]|nr:SpoIVB peptidase S55 [Terriglobia bacterium]